MVVNEKDYANETLGQRLKRLRTDNSFTQKHVADALNIDRSTYTYYERGKTEPNHATTIKLARIFNVSVQLIVTGSDVVVLKDKEGNDVTIKPTPKPPFNPDEDDSNDERALVAKYRCLPDDKREEVLEFITKLIEEDNKKKYFYKNQK